ncbi:MAG: Flp pilus assembly protein CpaB [Pseudomonadota bacterium]
MRLVFGLVLLLGLGLAGFAVYMAQDYINAHQAELARERAARQAIVPTKPVYVVTRAVRYGERLALDDLRIVNWPENAIPEGAFHEEAEIFPQGTNELRTVLRAMEKDEAILRVKVTEPGEDAGVSSRLAPGMRAFALRVDVASGVSGFLRPGDRVDVYWTGAIDAEEVGSREVTQLIQPGIKLIAVDQSADEDRSAPTVARTVTVEATPVQVAALAQAQATGRLQLSLVGAEDESTTEQVSIDQRVLLGIEREEVIEREEKRVCTIRTRRGAELVEIPIPCTN